MEICTALTVVYKESTLFCVGHSHSSSHVTPLENGALVQVLFCPWNLHNIYAPISHAWIMMSIFLYLHTKIILQ